VPRPPGLDDLLDYVIENMDVVEAARRLREALPAKEWNSLTFKGSTAGALLDRIERYEKDMPSWLKGTPEEYDRWLAELTPEDKRLAFYQWIGAKAVREAVDELRKQLSDDPVPVEHQHWDAGLVEELLDGVDPSQENYDPFPSAVPLNSLRCNNPDHIHVNGGSYRASCIVDLETWT
jgi:hypothetical protein